jgi:hypothetical protein
MIPRRQIKMVPRVNKLLSSTQKIQTQTGGNPPPPSIADMVREFVKSNPQIRQSVKNTLVELSSELANVNDIIDAYRVIDIYITQNTSILLTRKLKELLIFIESRI